MPIDPALRPQGGITEFHKNTVSLKLPNISSVNVSLEAGRIIQFLVLPKENLKLEFSFNTAILSVSIWVCVIEKDLG